MGVRPCSKIPRGCIHTNILATIGTLLDKRNFPKIRSTLLAWRELEHRTQFTKASLMPRDDYQENRT